MSAVGSALPAWFFAFAHNGALPLRIVRPDDDAAWAGSLKPPSSTKLTSAKAATIPKRRLPFLKSLLLSKEFLTVRVFLVSLSGLEQVMVIPVKEWACFLLRTGDPQTT